MPLGNWEGAFEDEAESGDLPYMRFKYIFRVRRMCFFCCHFLKRKIRRGYGEK